MASAAPFLGAEQASDDIGALPGVATACLVSRRRNGTVVTLQTYAREGTWPRTAASPVAREEPIVLLVHGMAGCAANWSFQLREGGVIAKMPFYAYDMLGCGRSGENVEANREALELARVERFFAPRQLIDDLENAWRAATRDGARPCIIVAHSYSTSLVTQWLARGGSRVARSRRVRGVVLIETHGSLPPIAASRAAQFARALPLALQHAALELYEGPMRWFRLFTAGADASLGALGPEGARSPEARRLWLKWECAKSAELYAASVCTADWATEDDFARAYAHTPLAVCWGSIDQLTPPDARFWANAAPAIAPALCARLVCAGYSHWPMLANPAFDAWLSEVVGAMREGARAVAALPARLPLAPLPTRCAALGADASSGASTTSAVCAACGSAATHCCPHCGAPYCGAECWRLAWARGHAAAHVAPS